MKKAPNVKRPRRDLWLICGIFAGSMILGLGFAKFSRPKPISLVAGGPAQIPVKSAQQIEDEIKGIDMTDQDQAILRAVRSSGKKAGVLANALISGHHTDKLGKLDKLVEVTKKSLAENPKESLAAIQKALRDLPVDGNYFDHASLLYAAAGLPVDRAEVRSMAWEEFQKVKIDPNTESLNVSPRDMTPDQINDLNRASAEAVLPLTAIAIVIGSSGTPEDAMSSTIDAVKFQPNLGIRSSIVSVFASRYPAAAPALRASLEGQGLSLEDKTPQ